MSVTGKTVRLINDAIVNYVSGHGTAMDPGVQNRAGRVPLDYDEIITLYKNYWLARKIINIPVDDMLKNGREITNLNKEQLKIYNKCWKDLKVNKQIKKALAWSRLIGGAGIIPVSAEMDLDEPFNSSTFTDGGLDKFVVLDGHELTVSRGTDVITDLKSRFFDLPEALTYRAQKIDISNVIIVHGEEMPVSSRTANTDGLNVHEFWGLSRLSYQREPVVHAHAVYETLLAMMQQNNVDIMKVPGLYNNIADCGSVAEQKEMDSAISARAILFAKFKSMFNVAMIDSDEEIERMKYDFAGLPQLVHEFMIAVSGASDIPLTRLAGISPGGLNSTGDADLENYYNNIASEQTENLTPIYDAIDRYMTLHCFGNEIELEYTINSPHVLSETEKAELESKRTETLIKTEGLSLLPGSLILRRLQHTSFPEITDEMIEELEATEAEETDDPDPDPIDDPEPDDPDGPDDDPDDDPIE